ncbi:hypothetical protein BC938DRAFT_477758 [Jimgerdemannia flammicorona]|uniref:Phospholipid/glycerol acyltransferase domain-containing protein n=1 Tax=Jimgerdemannia flammicorona TaxID=994334 RepID=A0A433QNV3_9FUNG|nr:hypothetical protein BC938DRAFT_477758 [Jimgerdemannia flammicorona]
MTHNNLVYDVFGWMCNVVLDIFFREIRPRGAHRIPVEGPVIFVAAPHSNQSGCRYIRLSWCGGPTVMWRSESKREPTLQVLLAKRPYLTSWWNGRLRNTPY